MDLVADQPRAAQRRPHEGEQAAEQARAHAQLCQLLAYRRANACGMQPVHACLLPFALAGACGVAEIFLGAHAGIMERHGTGGPCVDELLHQRVGIGPHLIWRALGGDAAVAQDDHMVGHVEGLLHVMGHQDGGQSHGIVELADQLGGRAQGDGVQPGEGLVVHDQFGVQRNGPRQRHAAGHAARDLAGHEVARTAQAHGMQLHEHDVADQFVGEIGVLAQREGHVVEHAHVGEQRAELEQHSHAPARGVQACGVHGGDVLAIEQYLPLLGMLLAADQAKHRGLAAARCPHQGRDLAARHLQRQVAQDHTFAIAEGDVAQLHERGGWDHAVVRSINVRRQAAIVQTGADACSSPPEINIHPCMFLKKSWQKTP